MALSRNWKLRGSCQFSGISANLSLIAFHHKCHPNKWAAKYHHRPRSEGDNALGSVRLFVCLSVCPFVCALLFEPFDLRPWYLPSAAKVNNYRLVWSKKDYCQSKIFVCVCKCGACAANFADAVDRLLILGSEWPDQSQIFCTQMITSKAAQNKLYVLPQLARTFCPKIQKKTHNFSFTFRFISFLLISLVPLQHRFYGFSQHFCG